MEVAKHVDAVDSGAIPAGLDSMYDGSPCSVEYQTA